MKVKVKDIQFSPYILSLTFSTLSWDECKQRHMSIIIISSYVFINFSQGEIMLHIIMWAWWNYTLLERVLYIPMGFYVFWYKALS